MSDRRYADFYDRDGCFLASHDITNVPEPVWPEGPYPYGAAFWRIRIEPGGRAAEVQP